MTIITAIDFSTATEPVLKAAKVYAQTLDAEVCLLHVDPPFLIPTGEIYAKEMNPSCRETERARLHRDARALEKAGIKVSEVLEEGPISDTIVEEAERLHSELIIAGSHGHGKLHNVLVGSTSEGILRKTKVPVLLVPVT